MSGRSRKETASGRPREHGPRWWLNRQRIFAGTYSRARKSVKEIACTNCGKLTRNPNTFGYCENCSKKASKRFKKQKRTRNYKPAPKINPPEKKLREKAKVEQQNTDARIIIKSNKKEKGGSILEKKYKQ